MDVPTLARNAVSVVLGTVEGVRETGVAELPLVGVPITYTDHTIRVDTYFGGEFDFPKIAVRTVGGWSDGLAVLAPEEPPFVRGEHVLVFLSKDTGKIFDLPDNGFTVEGLFQGKYTILPDELAVRAYDNHVVRLPELLSEIRTHVDEPADAGAE
jgi:hypothetical protein